LETRHCCETDKDDPIAISAVTEEELPESILPEVLSGDPKSTLHAILRSPETRTLLSADKREPKRESPPTERLRSHAVDCRTETPPLTANEARKETSIPTTPDPAAVKLDPIIRCTPTEARFRVMEDPCTDMVSPIAEAPLAEMPEPAAIISVTDIAEPKSTSPFTDNDP